MTHLSSAKTKNDWNLPQVPFKALMAREGTTLPWTHKSLNILKLHMEFCIS